MGDFMRNLPFDVPEPVRRFLQGEAGAWLRAEEFRDGSVMVVRVEVPGVDPDRDIDISVSGRTLTIEARREEESVSEGRNDYRTEFHYGALTRSFQLPAGVKEDDIQASYNNGILEVRVPSMGQESTPRRKVRVQRTDAPGSAPSGNADAGQGGMGSKVDPDFIPAESGENPDQRRAREHPEETGS
ncbi:Hsp20/alpha crystallin family protein [Arthrobacter cupressi]|uniref:Molecular chaperone IbpA, HSP20 family n=1 Tax=Arthrobacter cupressi TaxID=1045773 RepID=A0A1G8WSI6_9MICC|nr:Hsp20/alpha crystallin family protein [Arthrobacter cupressi]NYD79884.1 HSP20 family protein [Arthrobacter cupressi]SDJ81171.1 Molecular chaperone IbpA, HSP20 family [Arthrobacter cupressi]